MKNHRKNVEKGQEDRKMTKYPKKYYTHQMIENLLTDIICVLSMFICIPLIIGSVSYLPRVQDSPNPYIGSMAVCMCLLLLFLLFAFCKYLISRNIAKKKYVFSVMFGLIIIVQLGFLYILRPVPFWDELSTSEAAFTMYSDVTPSMPSQNGYFMYYGNNYPFVIAEYFICRFLSLFGVTQFWTCLLIINTCILDISILFFSKLLNLTYGRNTSFAFLFLCLFNPYTYLCVAFVYTTTWSLFFFSAELLLGLYLYKAITSNKKNAVIIVLGCILGMIVTAGATIRIVSVIPLIAVFICAFIQLVQKGRLVKIPVDVSKIVLSITALLVGIISVTICVKVAVAHYVPQELREGNFPPVHWIMMSFNERTHGGYYMDDEQITAQAAPEEKEAKDAAILRERLHDLTVQGKLIPFLYEKLKKTWTECWDSLFYVIDNSQSYGECYSWLVGKHSLLFRTYFQTFLGMMYLSIVAITVAHIRSGKRDILLLIFNLTFLGGVLFHLIWEANGFYSISFLPSAVILSARWLTEHKDIKNNRTALSQSEIILETNEDSINLQKREYQEQFSKTPTAKVRQNRAALPWVLLCCALLTFSIPVLSYEQRSAYHYRWVVNSQMRRPDLEFQILDLGKNKSILKQSFSVKKGFSFKKIELLIRELDSPGNYLFTLYNEDGKLLCTKNLTSSSNGGKKEGYRTVGLPETYGQGDYYFTIQACPSELDNEEPEDEGISFYCRSCLDQNYNPAGELLIDNERPNQGRKNLVFNVR